MLLFGKLLFLFGKLLLLFGKLLLLFGKLLLLLLAGRILSPLSIRALLVGGASPELPLLACRRRLELIIN
uniref:Candidate secreted effector n=1 Tax=Meloidogyne incognita TaxID=6306 RepID=A0A914LTA5_MELIC